MRGAKIIKGLKEAIAGDLARVTIEGETWAKVKDIHADQQEIMRINNALRDNINKCADDFSRLSRDGTKTAGAQNMWNIVAERVRQILVIN